MATLPDTGWKIAFFALMPLGLAVLVWFEFRWAAMICVLYGTIGLALDLATIVQIVTKEADAITSTTANTISGLFNSLLIVFGGRSFLEVSQGPMPLESRPPSPPSPS
jgi:hypothetical protein